MTAFYCCTSNVLIIFLTFGMQDSSCFVVPSQHEHFIYLMTCNFFYSRNAPIVSNKLMNFGIYVQNHHNSHRNSQVILVVRENYANKYNLIFCL